MAEDLFRPEVDATFAGITVRQIDDSDALRTEKKKKRDDPEPDGDAAVGRDGGDNVEIKNRDYEEEDEVAASEGADEAWRGGLGRLGHGEPNSRFLAGLSLDSE